MSVCLHSAMLWPFHWQLGRLHRLALLPAPPPPQHPLAAARQHPVAPLHPPPAAALHPLPRQLLPAARGRRLRPAGAPPPRSQQPPVRSAHTKGRSAQAYQTQGTREDMPLLTQQNVLTG